MSYVVYKHTTPSNKVYIGITSQKPEKRWNHGNGYSLNTHFSRAIKKYGWDNIKHEILYYDLSKTDAQQKEIELIEEYKSTDLKYGYNRTRGGDCRLPMSERAKLLTSLHNKGKKRSLETRKKISEAKKKRCNISL